MTICHDSSLPEHASQCRAAMIHQRYEIKPDPDAKWQLVEHVTVRSDRPLIVFCLTSGAQFAARPAEWVISRSPDEQADLLESHRTALTAGSTR